MMSVSVDISFRDALSAAGTGRPSALADILRSDAAIGEAERELLAELLEILALPGSRGRPSRPKISLPNQRMAAAEYLRKTDEQSGCSEAVLSEIKDRFGVKRSTVLAWVAEARTMIHQIDEMGLDGWSAFEASTKEST